MKQVCMSEKSAGLIVGAAMGNCVHVAGVANFLRMAQQAGFATDLLGAAVPVEKIVEEVERRNPDLLAISYRLTPANGERLLAHLLAALEDRPELTLLFGGTPEMAAIARRSGRFTAVFVGDEPTSKLAGVLQQLSGATPQLAADSPVGAPVAVSRRVQSLARAGDGDHSVPLVRHHFGLPDLEATIAGVRQIAEAEVLDVISIAPDQNAQEYFFRPDQMDRSLDGAGGVPLRREEDLRRLYQASRCGNFPYLRIYSGTQDLLKWADLSVRELHNAWGTIPLTWYSELDGRSHRTLEDAIRENMTVIRWYAERGLPVEINESHHWSLRDAPDAVAVAMAYISAYCAKKAGVRQYFAQYMFNTPNFTSAVSDLAKMAAKLVMIETLRDETFMPYRQVRAGLSHFAVDLHMAKGQLAAATMTMLGLRPHILHVVGYAEADHAATPEDVIESCKIVHGVMRNAFLGMSDPLQDPRVIEAHETLLHEAMLLVGTLERFGQALGSDDPLADPEVIAKAIRVGLIDAPHLRGQACARGLVNTGPAAGGCAALDRSGQVVGEPDRLLAVLNDAPAAALISGDASKLIGPPESLPSVPNIVGLLRAGPA